MADLLSKKYNGLLDHNGFKDENMAFLAMLSTDTEDQFPQKMD